MSIDDRPPSAWTESDLRELCSANRRETQALEFKQELNLNRDRDKAEVEHDALAIATGGGGVIVYGVAEVTLPDGARAAGSLRPLSDGALHGRLENLLDDRGRPRLPFQLHPEVPAEGGGLYLVLEIFGRRRPHQAQDNRYYIRRGTRVRAMDEAEVAEAYRERFLREVDSLQPIVDGSPAEAERFLPDVESRIHRGFNARELGLWRQAAGDEPPPGWMSVVVVPLPPRPQLLDPVRNADRFQVPLQIPDRWDTDHWPLEFFRLRPSPNGLFAQLPDRDDTPPAYILSMYRDGLMEFGTTLAPGLRYDDPADNRIIFSGAHPNQAHDYLQAFAVALGELGYEGTVGAQVSFENTRDVRLGVGEVRGWRLHRITEDHIRSDIWRGERAELLEAAGRIVKQVSDWVWLAAGVAGGTPFIDEQGRLVP